ncbi:MAG TPA: DUF892 family protein [Micromonospora sp.]|nr:DUF892 family protein [Micromonospora sp.]
MALKSPKGLFLHQIGAMRGVELEGATLLGLLRKHVRDEALEQLLYEFEQDKTEQMANINKALQIVGGSPLQTPSLAIDGLRERFGEFVKMQPAPEILDLIALGVADRLGYLGAVGYEELVVLTEVIGKEECKPYLSANVEKKQGHIARLKRCRDEMAGQLLAAV